MKLWLLAAGAVVPALAVAQSYSPVSPQAIVKPHEGAAAASGRTRPIAAGVPLLGFVNGASPTDVYAVSGTASRPQISERIALPENAVRTYLPPRQGYLMLEMASEEAPLQVWPLRQNGVGDSTSGHALAHAEAHPATVVFSPSGDAAAVQGQDGRLRIYAHLPLECSFVRELPESGRARATALAVSDDGELVARASEDGIPEISRSGQGWQLLPTSYKASAWTFLPHTHDLVLSDAGQRSVVLLPAVDETPIAARVLAFGFVPEWLGTTKEGSSVVAVPRSGAGISIDLPTGAIRSLPISATPTFLLELRDGHTFLISTAPRVAVIRAPIPTETRVSGNTGSAQ